MDRPLHVGLVGRGESALQKELQRLPGRPEVCAFDSLFGQTVELIAFEPDALFVRVALEDHPDEIAGALQLLRGIRPGCRAVLVADTTREIALAPVCARIGAQLLCEPFTPAQLLAAFDHALAGGDRPRAEVFLDLVHGIADEINNPLMFLMGHLQLLQLQMPANQPGILQEQIAAALAGAKRVHDTVERMRNIERAAAGPRRADPIDLHAEVCRHFSEAQNTKAGISVVKDPDDASYTIKADAEILRPALSGLAILAHEFQEAGCRVRVFLMRLQDAVRIRLSLHGQALEGWDLPRTYEPYYLSRVLRGSAQGLALFHLQAAAHGHRGRAIARRLPDGIVALDREMPVA